jgi:DNA primase
VSRIPQHFIDELIARADIVELIGSRVPLKKQGKEYKACCPFHGEKTPSFTVVPDKQFYHCFGCGAHGTALGFLMEHDHMSFIEAVEDLASRVGLEVPREAQPNSRSAATDGLFATLEKAADFYRRSLSQSDRGRQYFQKRGLTGETANRFMLGYAPDAWDALLRHLGTSEADRSKLLQVGLIIERDRQGREGASGHYDRFRDRVMFPIRDARGRTLGFGGRILDKGEPKYLNSPETELFHKGRELYGLYEARQASRTLNRILVVEGYMDVVRLHQAGVTYAVATLGTATTPEHLTRIFRICNEVVFCFDGDRAGRAAAWRALENSLSQIREGRQIRFLFLPDGHDPDSLVGEEGKERFEARIEQALPLADYLIQHLTSQVDTRSVDGRAKLGALAKPLLDKIAPGIYRELLTDELARVVGMNRARFAKSVGIETPEGDNRAPERPVIPPPRPQAAARRNLVRAAVHLLVHFPQIAEKITIPPGIAALDRPGIPLLLELLDSLRHEPCASTGALLERWRERPDVGALSKLAMSECLIRDAAGAARELSDALRQLADEGALLRREQLLSKHAQEGLNDAERMELQALLRARAPSEPADS